MLVVAPTVVALITPNPAVGTPAAFLCWVAAAFVDTGFGI
jgi:hypothetical protein